MQNERREILREIKVMSEERRVGHTGRKCGCGSECVGVYVFMCVWVHMCLYVCVDVCVFMCVCGCI